MEPQSVERVRQIEKSQRDRLDNTSSQFDRFLRSVLRERVSNARPSPQLRRELLMAAAKRPRGLKRAPANTWRNTVERLARALPSGLWRDRLAWGEPGWRSAAETANAFVLRMHYTL
jgi:hypothetical protein